MADYFSGLRGLVWAPHHPLPSTSSTTPSSPPRPPQPFVRPYNLITDYLAVQDIFRETLTPRFRFEPASTIACHLWCIPFLLLCPTSCFVLDNGTGEAVGCVIGTGSTEKYVSDYEEKYMGSLLERGMPPPITAMMPNGKIEVEWKLDWDEDVLGTLVRLLYAPRRARMEGPLAMVVEAYPAHLHVNILPAYQRKGHGSELISAFMEKLQETGVHGVHIIFPGENVVAGMFYRNYGFRRFEGILDGGRSWKLGLLEDGWAVCYVKEVK